MGADIEQETYNKTIYAEKVHYSNFEYILQSN